MRPETAYHCSLLTLIKQYRVTMTNKQLIDGLLDFLARSPTPFHATEQMGAQLEQAGFTRLNEKDVWRISENGSYFLTRNDSSIIAFHNPGHSLAEIGLRIVGAHTDSPCLKLKPQPDIKQNGYWQLGVEVYGGALLNPWFDRDLSLAGRVSVLTKQGKTAHCLIDFERVIGSIPSLAIHLDRNANKKRSINAQKHLPILLGNLNDSSDFKSLLLAQVTKQHSKLAPRQVLDFELSLYDSQPPARCGINQEFISSARLDNLLSCFVALQTICQQPNTPTLIVANDHEEVGSQSAAGAQGSFLGSVLRRLTVTEEDYARMISHSFMASVDNAHAVHPNFVDRHDEHHGPVLNAGPVIKTNANQRYASNSVSSALFRRACEQADVPVQSFVTRSDLACGSTIGPITAAEIGVSTVDIGVPQLAMHSIRELAGSADINYLMRALAAFIELKID